MQAWHKFLCFLGVSAKEDYDVNSLAVPRKAQEAIGAITCLTHTDGRKMTINVEYNQLDPLLRATISPEGDSNDSSGWSPFPGNPPLPPPPPPLSLPVFSIRTTNTHRHSHRAIYNEAYIGAKDNSSLGEESFQMLDYVWTYNFKLRLDGICESKTSFC